MEDQDHPGQFPGCVPDRRRAAFDRDALAVLADQHQMIGPPHRAALAQHLRGNVFHRFAAVFVHYAQHLLNRNTRRGFRGPAHVFLGLGIHERDLAGGVAADNRIADAAEGDLQPLPALLQRRFGLPHRQLFFKGLGLVPRLAGRHRRRRSSQIPRR